ncbi:MAG TPA: glycosyltransferase [Nitrococcus sp.]|nr:glycosyltransferase [Nitrococcus sp.]
MRETPQAALSGAPPPTLAWPATPGHRRAEAAPIRIAYIAVSYTAQRDGVSVYTENLLFELLRLASERACYQEFDVFACGQAATMLESWLHSRAAEPARAGVRIIATAKENFPAKYLQIPRLVRRHGPYDALFMPNLQPLWLPRQRSLSVLHDLTYRVAHTHFPRWRVHYMDLLTRFWLWRGTAIGYVSHTSKTDRERYYPSSRCKQDLYLPNGLPEKLTASPRLSFEAAQGKFQAPRLELLFVGRVNRLKGFDRVRRVCERLDRYAASHGTPITVHVVGKDTKESPSLLAGFTLRHGRLERHGYLDDAALNGLYRRSAFCLFLSRNEGFGLPLLESIWQRCVPLLSDIAVFREVMGEGYPLFAGDEPGLTALVAFIERLRSEVSYRREIFGHMDNTLARWADGYRQAAGNLLEWVHGGAGWTSCR